MCKCDIYEIYLIYVTQIYSTEMSGLYDFVAALHMFLLYKIGMRTVCIWKSSRMYFTEISAFGIISAICQ